MITAAAVLASFLGGQALADTKLLPNTTSPVADRSLQPWEAAAFAAFLVLLLLCAWIIRPKTKGWKFRLNSRKLLELGDKIDCEAQVRSGSGLRGRWCSGAVSSERVVQAQKRQLAEHMEDYFVQNEAKLDRLFLLLQASVVLLAVEAGGFLLDLTT